MGGVSAPPPPPAPIPGCRCRATRGQLEICNRLYPQNGSSQAHNLALTFLFMPSSLDSGCPTVAQTDKLKTLHRKRAPLVSVCTGVAIRFPRTVLPIFPRKMVSSTTWAWIQMDGGAPCLTHPPPQWQPGTLRSAKQMWGGGGPLPTPPPSAGRVPYPPATQ